MVLASSTQHDSHPDDAHSLVADDAQLCLHEAPVDNLLGATAERWWDDVADSVEEAERSSKGMAAIRLKKPKTRRRLGYINETLMLGLGLSGLVAGYVVWRLADGSLSIAVTKPLVEAELGRIIGGKTQIGDLEVAWDNQRRSFVVTASQVSAYLGERPSPLEIDRVDLSLNAQALLLGKVSISKAQASGVRCVLVVDREGRSAIGFGSETDALTLPRKKGTAINLRSTLTTLRKILLQNDKNSAIESLSLVNARLLIVDPDTNQRLTLSSAQLKTYLDRQGVVTVSASTLLATTPASVSIAISASDNPNEKLAVAAVFNQLQLSSLPASLRQGLLNRAQRDTAPVSGSIMVRLDGRPSEPIDVRGQLGIGRGQVQGINVNTASGSFDYQSAPNNLVVNNFNVDGPQIRILQGEGKLKQVRNQQQNLLLTARVLDFSTPLSGNLTSRELKFQGVLDASGMPVSGRLSAAAFGSARAGKFDLNGSNVDMTLNVANRDRPNQITLNVSANEVRDLMPNRSFNASNLTLAIDAIKQGGGTSALFDVRAVSGRSAQLALKWGSQSIDANTVDFSANGFVRPNGSDLSLPRAATLNANTLGFEIAQVAGTQNGQIDGLALIFNDIGTGRSSAKGKVGSLNLQAPNFGTLALAGKGVEFDVLQSGPTAARLSIFRANQLGVKRNGSNFDAANLLISGSLTPAGLSGAIVSARKVEITDSQQLLRPFWADNLRVSGDFARSGIGLNAFSFRHENVHLVGNTQILFSRTGKPSVDMDADIDGAFSVGTLLAAWPRGFLPETRENIRRLVPAGTAEVSRLSLAIPANLKPKQILPKSAINLDFALRDITVTYLQGLSPITNIEGIGHLRGDSLMIDIPHGRVGNIELTQGLVEIPQFMAHGGHVNIGANVDGDVADIVNEIDLPPLALLSKSNMDRQRLSGKGSGQLELTIPLKPNLQPEEIEVTVAGDFQNAGLSQVFAGLDATNATARLSVFGKFMSVTGTALVAGNQFAFDWGSTRDDGNRSSSSLSANGDVAITSLKEMGLDINAYASGTAAVTVTTSSQGTQFGEGLVRADFDNTNIRLPGDLWSKDTSSAASSSARLYPREGGGWNLQDVRFDASGATLRGAIDLAESGRLVDARFSKVMIDNAGDLSVDVTPGEAGTTISLRGAYLNLSPFLSQKNVSEQAVNVFDRPLIFSADIAKVSTSSERSLTNVHADIVRDLVGWRTLTANGESAAGSSQISLKVERDGRRSVSGTISDAGFFAQLLYPGAPILGGTGTIEGELPVVGANSSGSLSFKGKDINFAREGATPIMFEHVVLPMAVSGGVITLRDGQADGAAYTVKASGFVDLGAGRLDIRGVATPGGLNRVLAEIPLLGTILGGGADEGLLGMTFRASGGLQSPKLRTNPISALAPGLLRKIFESEAPLSPQPRFIVRSFAGDPIITKWPYGPTEDMSEAFHSNGDNVTLGPLP